jgi:hypothetical protein
MLLYFSILFLVCLANVYAITLCLGIKEKLYRFTFLALLSLCVFRYFILYFFSSAETPIYLYSLKNLAFVSIISIPPIAYICINVVGKGFCNIIDKVFVVIITLIFFVIVYRAPQGVVSAELGYKVALGENWIYILSIFQCSFAALMIYLSFKFLFIAKGYKYKALYFLFGLGYITSIIEAMLTIINNGIFQEAIISEGLILIAIIISIKTMQRIKA